MSERRRPERRAARFPQDMRAGRERKATWPDPFFWRARGERPLRRAENRRKRVRLAIGRTEIPGRPGLKKRELGSGRGLSLAGGAGEEEGDRLIRRLDPVERGVVRLDGHDVGLLRGVGDADVEAMSL